MIAGKLFYFILMPMQEKIQNMSLQLTEALKAEESRAKSVAESGRAASKADDDEVDSSNVIKKLEEELRKRDTLIEVCTKLLTTFLSY